jgi:hypothetical protein
MNAGLPYGQEIVPYGLKSTSHKSSKGSTRNENIAFEGHKSSQGANQAIWDISKGSIKTSKLTAEKTAEQIMGRIEGVYAGEMVELACSKPNAEAFAHEPDMSLYEEQVDGKELGSFTSSGTNGQNTTPAEETTPAEKSTQLELHNISAGKNAVQAIVTTNSNKLSANDMHCDENGGQIAGQGSGETLIQMWRALHSPSRYQQVNSGTTSKSTEPSVGPGASK